MVSVTVVKLYSFVTHNLYNMVVSKEILTDRLNLTSGVFMEGSVIFIHLNLNETSEKYRYFCGE